MRIWTAWVYFAPLSNRWRPSICPQMIEIVRKLVEKGAAYKAGTDVYFRVDHFHGLWKAVRPRDGMTCLAGARVEVDENKTNPLDLVVLERQ